MSCEIFHEIFLECIDSTQHLINIFYSLFIFFNSSIKWFFKYKRFCSFFIFLELLYFFNEEKLLIFISRYIWSMSFVIFIKNFFWWPFKVIVFIKYFFINLRYITKQYLRKYLIEFINLSRFTCSIYQLCDEFLISSICICKINCEQSSLCLIYNIWSIKEINNKLCSFLILCNSNNIFNNFSCIEFSISNWIIKSF